MPSCLDYPSKTNKFRGLSAAELRGLIEDYGKVKVSVLKPESFSAQR